MKPYITSRYLRGTISEHAIVTAAVLLQITACAAPAPEPGIDESKIAIQGLSKEQAQVVANAKEAQAVKSYSEQEQAAIDLAIRTVNERTLVSKDSISHLRIRSMQWPDSSLGCAESGVEYLQRVIPGYLVNFSANQQMYSVNVGDGSAIICDQINDLMAEKRKRGQAVIQMHEAAKVDLAKKLMVKTEQITVTHMQLETWPDSSLGCPVAGQQYQQGPVEGLRINMTCKDRDYEYRAALDGGEFVSCKKIVSCHETE